MGQRKAVTREMANRYRRASKRQKAAMLDEFVELHGCTRHHAGWLLRMWGKTVFERRDGELVKIVVGQRRPRRRGRRVYDEQVGAALRKVWYLFGCLCGKRLVAVLRTQLPVVEKFGELALDPDTRRKLTRISAATVDRLLRTEKRRVRIRGRSHTKATTRLMNQIPIRTFTEWQDARPGELGADLVGHDGGFIGGEHAFTLVLTDRVTQWTEVRAVLNKAQKWVFQALLLIRSWLPFALCALHTDSGSEFINNHLHRYCDTERIGFTRSRPNRKNDNNFTEQKNNDVVRKHVGYLRLQTEQEVALLNQLYDRLRLLINFFYPSQKLLSKTRQGARVRRVHDDPQTPYQRCRHAEQVELLRMAYSNGWIDDRWGKYRQPMGRLTGSKYNFLHTGAGWEEGTLAYTSARPSYVNFIPRLDPRSENALVTVMQRWTEGLPGLISADAADFESAYAAFLGSLLEIADWRPIYETLNQQWREWMEANGDDTAQLRKIEWRPEVKQEMGW